MLRYLAISLTSVFMVLTACQTSMVRQFSQVKPGMEKDDVLDLMGSPTQTQRFHGKDRWLYVFYEDRIRFAKEVHFFEGNAVYVGEIWQPTEELSAVAVDSKNEALNKELDAKAVQEVQTSRRAYDDYEKKTKGEDAVRYSPTFEPIR